MDFGASVAQRGPARVRWRGHTMAPRGDPRRPEASLGGFYLLGLGAELRTPPPPRSKAPLPPRVPNFP